MSPERIWAPWRLDYVTGDAEKSPRPLREAAWLPGADESCFLCRLVAEAAAAPNAAARAQADRENLVAAQGSLTAVVLNRFPYTNGHLLIAPRRHLPEPSNLTDAEHLEIAAMINRSLEILRRLMQPEGFNVGLNLGRVAGAGLPGHLHWHVVPRWNGDTNFMTALADTRVIPQSLENLWEALSREFAAE